jgi:hypothetical protein
MDRLRVGDLERPRRPTTCVGPRDDHRLAVDDAHLAPVGEEPPSAFGHRIDAGADLGWRALARSDDGRVGRGEVASRVDDAVVRDPGSAGLPEVRGV